MESRGDTGKAFTRHGFVCSWSLVVGSNEGHRPKLEYGLRPGLQVRVYRRGLFPTDECSLREEAANAAGIFRV